VLQNASGGSINQCFHKVFKKRDCR